MARFWADKWLNGEAPKQIAPLCFPLAARKNLSVKEALTNGRWLRGLQRITTEAQLDQFINLWLLLQQVNLNDEIDTISWHFSADGRYSASSAYKVQFLGRLQQPNLDKVWQINAEGKVKFFFWLALQNRNWTAEKRRARGLTHSERCCLCDQSFETASHLALSCPFAREVWHCFQASDPQAVHLAASSSTLETWWAKASRGKADQQMMRALSLSVYIIWHLWKERGSRIFQDDSMPALARSALVRADLELLSLVGDDQVQHSTS